MKYVKQFSIILGISFLAELLEDPIRNFRSYVQKGLIEKDGNEVVIYMDL